MQKKDLSPEEATLKYLWKFETRLTPFEIDLIARELKSKHIHCISAGIRFVNKRVKELLEGNDYEQYKRTIG